MYHSSKYGYSEHKKSFVSVGTPGFFKLKESTGTFSYDPAYCLTVNTETATGTSGIDIKYKRNLQVSKNVWCENSPAKEEPINQNRESSLHQTGEDLMASTNYIDLGTQSALELDMSYWYTIPLSTLGIDKNYLTTTGISIRQTRRAVSHGCIRVEKPYELALFLIEDDREKEREAIEETLGEAAELRRKERAEEGETEEVKVHHLRHLSVYVNQTLKKMLPFLLLLLCIQKF